MTVGKNTSFAKGNLDVSRWISRVEYMATFVMITTLRNAGRRAYIAVYYSWLPRAWDGALNEVKSAESPGEPQPTIKSTFKVGGWNYRQANARC